MAIKAQGLCPLIQVFDMPASIAFYRDILGFTIEMQSRPGDHFDWALLRMGSAELMLNTAYEADKRPAAPDVQRQASHGDTAFYFHCSDLDEAYDYLTSKGVRAHKPATRDYGMRQLNFSGPGWLQALLPASGEMKAGLHPGTTKSLNHRGTEAHGGTPGLFSRAWFGVGNF